MAIPLVLTSRAKRHVPAALTELSSRSTSPGSSGLSTRSSCLLLGRTSPRHYGGGSRKPELREVKHVDCDDKEPDVLLEPTPPTKGSIGHDEGSCKPCAFVYKGGCTNGFDCQFCHLCEPGEKRRRRKEQKQQVRSRQMQHEVRPPPELLAPVAFPPNEELAENVQPQQRQQHPEIAAALPIVRPCRSNISLSIDSEDRVAYNVRHTFIDVIDIGSEADDCAVQRTLSCPASRVGILDLFRRSGDVDATSANANTAADTQSASQAASQGAPCSPSAPAPSTLPQTFLQWPSTPMGFDEHWALAKEAIPCEWSLDPPPLAAAPAVVDAPWWDAAPSRTPAASELLGLCGPQLVLQLPRHYELYYEQFTIPQAPLLPQQPPYPEPPSYQAPLPPQHTIYTAPPSHQEFPIVIQLAAALLNPPEKLSSAECESIGSELHSIRGCKPCAFLYKQGCDKGADCQFCHLCEPGEKRRRQKEKKQHMRCLRLRRLGA